MISLKEFFSFKNNKAFWLNLIAMPIVVIAIIFGVLHWLDVYTHHGKSIMVPNVNGLPYEEARNELSKKNLNVEIVDSNYVKGMLPGAILEQKPIDHQHWRSAQNYTSRHHRQQFVPTSGSPSSCHGIQIDRTGIYRRRKGLDIWREI